jgi:hypothetical protein
MGAIFKIGDAGELARLILDALDHPEQLQKTNTDFSAYSPDIVAESYEKLFGEIATEIH